jgi:hypothetical protein
MNLIYAINYDLKKPHQDYAGLYGAIKGCGVWWHHLGSTWLVDTNLDAGGIWGRLLPHIDGDDRVLVIGVTGDYSGWLSKDAWEWIKTRQQKLAA